METKDGVKIHYQQQEATKTITADILLVATGRKPNTETLTLGQTNIAVTSRGAIVVNEQLQTSVANVWALGDVTGGLQFTYISLDDYRIVTDQLFGKGTRTTNNRGAIPYSVFLTPPLSHVGVNERHLKASGKEYRRFTLPVAGIPKARVAQEARGLFKVFVDPETSLILGASLYGLESHEMINLIALAIDFAIPYNKLRDRIYTHPTMTESLNDLLK